MMCGLHPLLCGYGTWVEMSSTVVLMVRDGVRVLFDTGAAAERQHLLRALAARHLQPEDIDIVANTHLHMDHCENNPLFSRARWYCSDQAHDALVDLVLALNADPVDLNAIVAHYLGISGGIPKTLFNHVVRFLTEDAVPEKMLGRRRVGAGELDRLGIGVVPTPGHADGHVSFLCQGGGPAPNTIIAGDAIVSRQHFQSGRRALFTKDAYLAEQSRGQLAAFGGVCLPGHGEAFVIPTDDGRPLNRQPHFPSVHDRTPGPARDRRVF